MNATATTASLRAQHLPTSPMPVRQRSLTQILTLPKEKQFPAMLESFKREIAMALPAHLTPDRMARLAMTAFSQNRTLAECDPKSIFSAVIMSSQLGLEIGVDGQAYLVPYKGKATFVPGWKGYVELINRAGKAGVWTGAVFEGDKFEFALGDSPFVRHQPTGQVDETKDNLRFVYAIGRVHSAQWPVIEVWPIAKVKRHLARYNKVGSSHYALKDDTNFVAYARKVALMQVMKYMPKSVELRAAMAVENSGGQGFDIGDVLEGEWSNVAADAAAAEEHDADPAENSNNAPAGEASPSDPDDDGADQGSASSTPPQGTGEATSSSGSSSTGARRRRTIE